MLNRYKKNPAIWIYLCFMISGTIFLLIGKKGDFVLLINRQHTTYLDYFFKYLTYLGNGWVFVPVFILTLFIRYYNSLLLSIGVATQTLLVQILKRLVFPDMIRPSLYINEEIILHYVKGVDVHGYHAFPSGHTATAFAIATFLMVTSKNNVISSLAFITAVGVAISRIYLLQHFLVDVYFGSVIGVFSVLAFHIPSYNQRLHEKKPWNLSLLNSGR